MAIISKPTGLSTEEKLLYEILRQLDQLTKIMGQVLNNVTTTTTTTILP